MHTSAKLNDYPCCAKCGEVLELTAEGDGPPCACGHQRTRCVKWLRIGGVVCPCHLDAEHDGAHMTVFTGRTDEARKTLRRNVRAQLVWVCAEATLRSVEKESET